MCGQQKGTNRAKTTNIYISLFHPKKKNYYFFWVKKAGRHFGFLKKAGRHQKGAGRRALQKRPRQNTESRSLYLIQTGPDCVHSSNTSVYRIFLHGHRTLSAENVKTDTCVIV